MERTVALREQIVAGLISGIAGGMLFALVSIVTILRSGTGTRGLTGVLQFIAATVLGPAAYGTPAAVPLGIVLHFCVAVGWALGFVYLVRSQPYLVTRPWISGAGFGLVVYVFMQIVLLTGGQYHGPSSPAELDIALVSHVFFYGIPVALVASRLLRASTGSGRA